MSWPCYLVVLNNLQSCIFANCHLSLCAMQNIVSLVQADGLHVLPPIEESAGLG